MFRKVVPDLLVGAGSLLGFLSWEMSAGAPSVRDPFSLAPFDLKCGEDPVHA